MSMNARARALLAPLCLAVVAGCAGARVEVTAETSRYAISLSQSIRDRDGRLYDPTVLEKVGTFGASTTRVGFLYSLLTIAPTVDISDQVNAQVAAAGGEAIIKTAVIVGSDCSPINVFPILNIIPIWPGCIPVTVTGDIVRRKGPPPGQ